MKIHLQRWGLAFGIPLVILLSYLWPIAEKLTPRQVLIFCLSHQNECAFSVNHVTQGWERHWNGDRAQVTASAFKIIPLIAYAEAVVDNRIDPGRLITRDEWARFWVGLDGGALSKAWERLGQPTSITVDDLVSAMMQESDNAAPDWLLNELGEDKLKWVVQRYVKGFHDIPSSINSLFVTWGLNPLEIGSGNRLPKDYSGFEIEAYQEEVKDVFENLHDTSFVEGVREIICVAPPWKEPPPKCYSAFETTNTNFVQLNGRFFMRSTTRTYTRLMTRLLMLNLLKPEVSSIVRRHLEWRLRLPNFAAAFTRHAGKSGTLAPQDVVNWTTYIESRDTGSQVVVSIFMHNLQTAITEDDLARFTEEIGFDPAFAQEVASRTPY